MLCWSLTWNLQCAFFFFVNFILTLCRFLMFAVVGDWRFYATCKLYRHCPILYHYTASNTVYRKAILKAIEDLHDCHLRSNVDAIRRHVMSAFEPDHSWNEVVFMKTLKTVVQDGEVEQHTFVNCALSPEYKRRRADSLSAYMETKKAANGVVVQVPFVPGSNQQQQQQQQTNHHHHHPHPHHPQQHHGFCESPKPAPKRKVEHDKYKIMPKPLFDRTM